MTPRRALLLATTAYVVGQSAHTTFMYHLVPLALRAGGIEGRDALVFASVAVAMGVLVVPAGRLVDRIPRRRGLRIGLALLGLAYASLLAPPSLAAIMVGVASTGGGLAFLFVSFTSYVADLLAGAERSAAYGRTAALSTLAGALGPVLAALVLRYVGEGLPGIRGSALLFGVVTLVAATATMGLPSARRERGPAPSRIDPRAVAPIMLLYLLMGVGYGMTLPYFAVHFLDNVRLGGEAWGYVLGAATALTALGSYAAGRLAKRVPPGVVAVGGQVGLFAASLAFLAPVGAAAQAAAYLARSTFSATTAPVVNSALMDRVREEVRAESQGYTSLAWNVGWTIGAASGAVLLATLGGAVFPLGGALALAGVLAGVGWMRHSRAA